MSAHFTLPLRNPESVRSAADLAKAIQTLQDLIQTNVKLSGPFITDPNVMDDGLKAIVDATDVLPGHLLGLLMRICFAILLGYVLYALVFTRRNVFL